MPATGDISDIYASSSMDELLVTVSSVSDAALGASLGTALGVAIMERCETAGTGSDYLSGVGTPRF